MPGAEGARARVAAPNVSVDLGVRLGATAPCAAAGKPPAPAAQDGERLSPVSTTMHSVSTTPGDSTLGGSAEVAGHSSAKMACTLGHASQALKHEDTKDYRECVLLFGRAYVIAAVFDGHGGAEAAKFCEAHMIDYIEEAARAAPAAAGDIRSAVTACQVNAGPQKTSCPERGGGKMREMRPAARRPRVTRRGVRAFFRAPAERLRALPRRGARAAWLLGRHDGNSRAHRHSLVRGGLLQRGRLELADRGLDALRLGLRRPPPPGQPC